MRLQRTNKCFAAVLYRKQQSVGYTIKKKLKFIVLAETAASTATADGGGLQWLSLTLGGEAAALSDAAGVMVQ